MNYYLIIILLASIVFLFPIFNLNTYGYEGSKLNFLNEFKNFVFTPIKNNILPQYDESTTQPITQVKSEKEVKANDNDKSSKSDESDESAQQPITQVKSEKEVKATDNDKSDNSEDVVVTVVTSDGSEVKSEKEVKANDNDISNKSDKPDESAQQPITQVKSEKEVKANDNDKSSKSDESVDPSMGVKILSPKSGKEIPVGNLTIFGVSTDNEKSNCSVSVDWNNEKPFQKAKAAGPYGNEDYSSWAFTYSPSYHTIENGLNDLTSKLECVENSKVTTKWNSVNVTGVITKDANPTSTLVYDDPQGILPQLKPLSTNPSANITGIASNETTIAPTKLSAHLVLPKDQVFPGEPQKFMVKISDPKTLQGVAGAELAIKVVQGSVLLDEYNGTSDESGEYSWNLNSDTLSGKHDVLVSASANGYEPASITGSFDVQKQLLVEASLLKDLVFPGDKQTIDVKVMDANTKEIVSGANVMAKIGQKNFSASVNDSGVISYSWDTPNTSGGNSYKVALDVSSEGYPKINKTVSFKMDKPQNLLEPPISNYEDKIITINNKDLNKNLESQNNFRGCTDILSSDGCSAEVNDKPVLNPTTDDKPVLNPTTDDKPVLNPTTDDKPILNATTDDKPILDTDNENENIQTEENQNEKIVYDFLASTNK